MRIIRAKGKEINLHISARASMVSHPVPSPGHLAAQALYAGTDKRLLPSPPPVKTQLNLQGHT